jgi:hypothetical protein
VLILIAADRAGPYTLVDGNHRAAALYRNYLIVPNVPWRALLVASKVIGKCVWHVESKNARANSEQIKSPADVGALR